MEYSKLNLQRDGEKCLWQTKRHLDCLSCELSTWTWKDANLMDVKYHVKRLMQTF
jgi:hypothetical protein